MEIGKGRKREKGSGEKKRKKGGVKKYTELIQSLSFPPFNIHLGITVPSSSRKERKKIGTLTKGPDASESAMS